ncbi:MAG: hypothetical protein FWD42_03280 [Solirubrobacterales bacterium]|nr:hypothetical protein [Solirubrobacterales bacterium]
MRPLDEIRLTSDARERLAWPARCGQRRLVVSIAPPSPSASIDVLAAAARAQALATAHSALASLAIAARRPGVVAARGFVLRTRPPVLFTLTVLLAELHAPPPAGDQRDAGSDVAPVRLPAGRGVRIVRHNRGARPDARGGEHPDARAAPGPLMVQYLLHSGLGALALTFTTPSCQPPAPAGARSRGSTPDAFIALFGRLAGSCTVEPAAAEG